MSSQTFSVGLQFHSHCHSCSCRHFASSQHSVLFMPFKRTLGHVLFPKGGVLWWNVCGGCVIFRTDTVSEKLCKQGHCSQSALWAVITLSDRFLLCGSGERWSAKAVGWHTTGQLHSLFVTLGIQTFSVWSLSARVLAGPEQGNCYCILNFQVALATTVVYIQQALMFTL